MTEYAHYEAGAHKLLSDNRRLYFVQSQLTTREKRAEFSEAEAYAREQSPIDPIPCYADRRGF